MIVFTNRQEFAPRELCVPANPSVGALAAKSSTLFQSNPSPINRTKRKKRRKSGLFGRGQVRNDDQDRMAAPDRGSTKDGTATKPVRFPHVSFCRATSRKNYSQHHEPTSDKNTIPKHILVPSTIEIPSNKPGPSDESPRFSTTSSRFRFVSFRRGSNRKTSRRSRSKALGTRRKNRSPSNKRKRAVDTTESEAAKIMTGIISGNPNQAKRIKIEDQDFMKNSMCHPYKYCYCENCFDPKWDWEFHESSELNRSGKYGSTPCRRASICKFRPLSNGHPEMSSAKTKSSRSFCLNKPRVSAQILCKRLSSQRFERNIICLRVVRNWLQNICLSVLPSRSPSCCILQSIVEHHHSKLINWNFTKYKTSVLNLLNFFSNSPIVLHLLNWK